MSGERAPHNGKGEQRKDGDVVGVHPAYLTWQGLAAYSSCSKRWLQDHVPRSLRFRLDGKVLVKVEEFDQWIQQYRQGADLNRMLTEVLDGADSISR